MQKKTKNSKQAQKNIKTRENEIKTIKTNNKIVRSNVRPRAVSVPRTTSTGKVGSPTVAAARAVRNRRTIVDVCIGIFTKNSNKPMHVKNVYSAMRQRHWRTEGKTPKQTIASKLNGDYRFVRVSPNTFKMSEEFYKNRTKTINKKPSR